VTNCLGYIMIEKCLWTEISRLPGRPAAPLPGSTDVAIVGGGYTGLSAARTLARNGVDATVLEQHQIGWGASSRNGGFVLPGFKPEMEELAHRLGPRRAQAMFQLSLDAIRFLADLVMEERIECDFARCGAVTLAAKPTHLPGLERTRRFLRDELGYRTEMVGPADLNRVIGSTRYHGALLDPEGCSLQPAKYVAGLAVAASHAGARLIENVEVTRIRRAADGFMVETSQGVVRTSEVLAATNGYTPAALPRLRRRVIPIGSYIIATPPLSPQLAQRLIPGCRVLSDTKNLLFYFRLSPDGRLVFGGRASFTPASPRRSAAILAAGMREVFPELKDVGIEYTWSGKVGYPIDHLPHAGRMDGVYYALGYCGHGVALATYLGHRLGQVISGSGDLPDLGGTRFKAVPLFNGFPWFLPLVGGYYRALDWLS
jgi:glycine/D-amino acid oxidase-like deaminating enzyme